MISYTTGKSVLGNITFDDFSFLQKHREQNLVIVFHCMTKVKFAVVTNAFKTWAVVASSGWVYY